MRCGRLVGSDTDSVSGWFYVIAGPLIALSTGIPSFAFLMPFGLDGRDGRSSKAHPSHRIPLQVSIFSAEGSFIHPWRDSAGSKKVVRYFFSYNFFLFHKSTDSQIINPHFLPRDAYPPSFHFSFPLAVEIIDICVPSNLFDCLTCMLLRRDKSE